MRQIRRFAMMSLVAAVPLMAACAPSIGSAVGAVQMARGVMEGKQVYDAVYEARKRSIPIAGTYRLTFSFPGEAERSLYVRTLSNANMPMAIDRRGVNDRTLSADDLDLNTGYMVNVMGAGTVEEVPDSLGQRGSVGGFLIVSDTLGRDAQNRQRFVGSFQVRADTAAGGEVGEVARLLEPLVAEIRKANDEAERRWERASRREKERFVYPVEDHYAVISLAPDGAVHTTDQVLKLNGVERLRIRAERVSETAYHIPAENLERPSIGDLFRGTFGGGGE